MKLKLLSLFFVLVGWGALVNAQTIKRPYNNLLITEALLNVAPNNYVEFTNTGDETINLHEFEFGLISNSDQPFKPRANTFFRLPEKMLAPGKSFVIAVSSDFEERNWFKDPVHNAERVMKPEFRKVADMLFEHQQANMSASDYRFPAYLTMETWNGKDCWYLRHHYINEETQMPDSMVIDQVGGVFDEADGTSQDQMAHDVAGVYKATNNSVLIRRSIVKTGITEFSSAAANIEAAKMEFDSNRGLDLDDSEWIPVPQLTPNDAWRSVFWTAGNSVNAKLDANTLVSKTGKVLVDTVQLTITVPWGVRNLDSIMYQFKRTPGLAWKYDFHTAAAGTAEYTQAVEDSAYNTVRTGDKLTLYICGNKAVIKEFSLIALDPTASDNIVIPKNGYDYNSMKYGYGIRPYSGIRVTEGIAGMDTISKIDYATRVDTLFKYLEKAPKATWKITFKSGVQKPDLTNGDILRVTSENGVAKNYFLKLDKFVPDQDAYLSSITWPDIPESFKGAVAGIYGWKGDTIPGFSSTKLNYIVNIPLDFQGIPALMFTRQQFDSKVVVTRAKSLDGSIAERTVTFKVFAENDTIFKIYTVQFEKEKDPANIQPFIAEPFISQVVFEDEWGNPWIELYNPSTRPMDMSDYMFTAGWGGVNEVFGYSNATWEFADAYKKYVPGKKWQDEVSWVVQPRILEPDMAVNPIVYPGDVFVMTQHGDGGCLPNYEKEVDVNFATGKNPWGVTMKWESAVHIWEGATYYLYKITNDSVKNGLKPANDIKDFKLLETFGNGVGTDWIVGGEVCQQITGYTRKPNIYKGNIDYNGSFGTDKETSEWNMVNEAYFINLNYGWPDQIYKIVDGIGAHIMNEVTFKKSTVSSKVLKVSPGYSLNENIKGLISGTTVTGFYQSIIKADEKQTLTVKSTITGLELVLADQIVNGDSLIVLSADSTNTSKYLLKVTETGLSNNATLTSTSYVIDVTAATGTIAGFPKNTLLKTLFDGVVVPAGAVLTITDENDAYMSLIKLNYDSAYVNVLATDKIYFEVIAENGTTKIVYQLKPTVTASEAYVTSDIYSVDQVGSVIDFIPGGTSVHSLLGNVIPVTGATMVVYDKGGFERTDGDIYRDDILVVKSADGNTTKAYHFSMLSFKSPTYMAFVISDEYPVDQVKHEIASVVVGTSVAAFKAKLFPAPNATIKVLDKSGNESTSANMAIDDQLLVTAADGTTTAIYSINFATKTVDPLAQSIKMYPNPTNGKVTVQGLTNGNRVRVYNASGITLRDVIVENSTDYISLEAQPAGIYIFVISAGNQNINIQKIIKK